VRWLKAKSFPGFDGQSIYSVGRFFIQGFFEEDFNLRASSLAFNFFLAIFPSIIFFFTLIAYVPIEGLDREILEYLKIFLPENAYELIITTVKDIVENRNTGLLSFGFLAAIYFATNGIASMISSFEHHLERKEQRSWFKIRIRALGLTMLISFILITMILIITYVNVAISYINSGQIINQRWETYGLQIFETASLFILLYFIFSSLYYYGSSRTNQWRFFSAGSTVATLLSLVATEGFSYYISQFDSYNKLYGSIGTIIAILVLIYFNCMVLLIGFDLNKSIDMAKAIEDELKASSE
jgi:membrane protein